MHLRASPIVVYAIHRYGTRNRRGVQYYYTHDIAGVDYILLPIIIVCFNIPFTIFKYTY